jgi:beta-galactosidase beta subunit
MRITRICANTANDDADKNRNPNNTNASEFTNNTNKNKIQNAKIKIQNDNLKLKINKIQTPVIASPALLLMIVLKSN